MKFLIEIAAIVFVSLFIQGYSFPSHSDGTSGVTELVTNATNLLYQCIQPGFLLVRLNLSEEIQLTLNLRRHETRFNKYPPTVLLSKLNKQDTDPQRKEQVFVPYTSEFPDSRLFMECQQEHANNLLYISGVILHQGADYVIQSLKREESSNVGVIIIKWFRVSDKPRTHDYIISESSRRHRNVSLSRDRIEVLIRDRRSASSLDAIHTFTVKVLVVVDFNVYARWLSRVVGQSDEERSFIAKNEIQKYYHHVINGIDLRYQTIGFTDFRIRIQLSGIIIIDNDTVLYNSTTTGSSELDADIALKTFRSWINDTSWFPEHNHAILFTGYDLYTTKKNNEKIGHTSGLAFIGTLCEPGDSVSIVEEQGGFQSIGTASHEIGHSLGALHDGENNTCHSEDRFIMAASGFGPVPEEKKYNPWIFSPCTVEYFREYIASLLVSDTNCLVKNNSDTAGPDDHLQHPGEHYSPDEQCRQIWGPTSYLCRGAEFGDASTMCTAMYCRDPSTESDCVLHTAARGTSCGDKQWCMNGHCVYSPRAPRKQGPCVLGDQPGPAFNSMTCEKLIAESPSYCYQEKVRARCCNTCWSKYTYKKGCEYGDRIQGCRLWHCSHFFESRDIQSECCGTCGLGDFITMSHSDSPLSTEQLTSTASPAKLDNPATCTDSDRISGVTCTEFIQSRGPFVCYNNNTEEVCCDSCRKFASQIYREGCKYGDRIPSLCKLVGNQTELTCVKYGHICCQSCSVMTTTSAAPRVVNTFLTLFICSLYFVLTLYIYNSDRHR